MDLLAITQSNKNKRFYGWLSLDSNLFKLANFYDAFTFLLLFLTTLKRNARFLHPIHATIFNLFLLNCSMNEDCVHMMFYIIVKESFLYLLRMAIGPKLLKATNKDTKNVNCNLILN